MPTFLKRNSLWIFSILSVSLLLLSACGSSGSDTSQSNNGPANVQYSTNSKVLNIIAGSEQDLVLKQFVTPWCHQHGIICNILQKGSVDQARFLKMRDNRFDVYWFASSVFEQIGDQANVLKDVQPMFITPLVYAGWKSEMQKLGFVGRSDVSIAEILNAVESQKTTTWLTNPTQSNSGATVFFAFLNYFAGNKPQSALTMEQLRSAPVQDGITQFIRAMDQTPPSSGTLMNSCIANPQRCRTLFVYEDLIIEKNQELVKSGHEPLYVVYPKESLAISDAPMGFYPHSNSSDNAKEQVFLQLQQYLRSDGVQQQLEHFGRRPITSIGLSLSNPDLSVFNPDWGVKPTVKIQPITYPSANVIEAALDLYQTTYRHPVHAIYCLDSSGSMSDNQKWDHLKNAAQLVFDQNMAREYYLQANPSDLTTVMLFNGDIVEIPQTVQGNDPGQMQGLYQFIANHSPDDGTDFYTCLSKAAELFKQQQGESRKRLVILMTDGKSDTAGRDEAINALKAIGVRVICIPFGQDADESQLRDIASQTGGTVTAKEDIVTALREATAYK